MTPVRSTKLALMLSKPLSRLRQESNLQPDKIKELEAELDGLKGELEGHQQMAQKSHEAYVKVTSRCASDWKLIKELKRRQRLVIMREKGWLL